MMISSSRQVWPRVSSTLTTSEVKFSTKVDSRVIVAFDAFFMTSLSRLRKVWRKGLSTIAAL